MTGSLREWLEDLGLGRYAEAFEENYPWGADIP